MNLLLGIDVGTYSSKGVLTTPEGEVLKSAVVEHTMSIPKPGWAEQGADGVWWSDVVQICRTLLDGAPYSGADVAGVALSAIGPCLLPLDVENKPLRAGILYGVDTRASEEILELEALLGKDTIFNFSGMELSSQAIAPKMLWLKKHEPEIWAKTRMLTTASSYLTFKLTSRHVMDKHTASHHIMLINPQTGQWDSTFAQYFCSLDMLPELAYSDELAGYVTPEAAQITGLKAGTPVAVGAVDALSEAISVGAVQDGDLMVMYGSSVFFILVQPAATPNAKVWSLFGAFQNQHNMAAGMSTTGSLTRWFKDQLAPHTDYHTLFSDISAIPAGSEGIIVLPYFSGERSPIYNPRAKGVFFGLDLSHSRAHMFKAVLEGVGYGIRHNMETFASLGANIKRVVAVGGGTKNHTWVQIVSDITGVAQQVPKNTIGASLGNAFLAGLVSGLVQKTDLPQWVGTPETVIPQNQDVYHTSYQKYLDLYRSTAHLL